MEKLFLALSCLQGRPMDRTLADLAFPGVGGVQLTPGNMPTPRFEERVRESGLAWRTHHGFTFRAFKTREVWSDDGVCRVSSDSVHPPAETSPAASRFLDMCERRAGAGERVPVLETMYPGWALSDGGALEDAMRRRFWLAVDVSHLHIQREQGRLGDATLARVLDYDRIAEVHVSANDGRRDLHAPLTARSFGLDWARARRAAGVPVILECYFHRLSPDERRRQVDLVLEGDASWQRRKKKKQKPLPTKTSSTSGS